MTEKQKEELADLQKKQVAYRAVFCHPMGIEALRDLILFCKGGESTVPEDPNAPIDTHRMCTLEGRRQVMLRLNRFLNLTDEELLVIYASRPFKP